MIYILLVISFIAIMSANFCAFVIGARKEREKMLNVLYKEYDNATHPDTISALGMAISKLEEYVWQKRR